MDDWTPQVGKPLGFGVDASPQSRPGVPREDRAHAAGARRGGPEQQRGTDRLSALGVRSPTPVFGTAQPAHGLSGVVRRAAYRTPEQRATRWFLLAAADRIDVLGHRLSRALWVAPAAAALVLGYVAVSRALGRR